MMPEISVIMPAYNAGGFIAESIKSVLAQTFTRWELIVVDDGSTDNTALIVKEYQLAEPRISYIYQQNGRQGKARNTGIKQSNSDYIAFLDADDLWTNNKLQLQLDILKARPEIDLVFSQGYTLMPDGTTSNYDVNVKEWDAEHNWDEFVDWNQVPILSAVVKRKVIEDAGFFSEDFDVQNAEDYHLWLRLLHNGCRFLSTADRLFYYRVHQTQTTYQNKGMHKDILQRYFDLTEAGVIKRDNKALQYRVKWLIMNHVDPGKLYRRLKPLFPGRKAALYAYIQLNKMLPRHKLTQSIGHRFL